MNCECFNGDWIFDWIFRRNGTESRRSEKNKDYLIKFLAARQFKRKDGKSNGKRGRKTMFSPEKEQGIVSWLFKCVELGGPRTKAEFLDTVFGRPSKTTSRRRK
jgi:hypothetical protein